MLRRLQSDPNSLRLPVRSAQRWLQVDDAQNQISLQGCKKPPLQRVREALFFLPSRTSSAREAGQPSRKNRWKRAYNSSSAQVDRKKSFAPINPVLSIHVPYAQHCTSGMAWGALIRCTGLSRINAHTSSFAASDRSPKSGMSCLSRTKLDNTWGTVRAKPAKPCEALAV